jgi:hypothetical protein
MEATEFRGRVYDQRHGGPFDRGSADSYYHRPRRPHYFKGDTHNSPEIIPKEGTKEYQDYMAGYEYNELYGYKKEW